MFYTEDLWERFKGIFGRSDYEYVYEDIEEETNQEGPLCNQVMGIVPYWVDSLQTWAFDDELTGLKQELFVAGIPKMINHIVEKYDIKDAKNGFRLIFSAEEFLDHHLKLEFQRTEGGGSVYKCDETNSEGWLCPALFKYFSEAPQNIYCKAENLYLENSSET